MHLKILTFTLLPGLLVLPLSASGDPLVGTWESSIAEQGLSGTARLTFQADGIFHLSQVGQVEDDYFSVKVEEDDDLTAEEEALNQYVNEIMPKSLVERISFQANGTYATAGDSLSVDIVELDWLFDDRDFSEFFTEFFTQLFRNWADFVSVGDGREFSGEEYSALEQEYVSEALAVFTKEGIIDALNNLPSATYAVEGETLLVEGLLFLEAEKWILQSQTLLDGETLSLESGMQAKRWNTIASMPQAPSSR